MRYHKSWPSIVFNSNRLLGRRQRDQTDEDRIVGNVCRRTAISLGGGRLGCCSGCEL